MTKGKPRPAPLNRDPSQLRAYVSAIAELDAQIAEINKVKSDMYKEAAACGFPRPVMRDLTRMNFNGKLPESDIPSAYDGIINARGLAVST